jgi:hypothetical protein
MMMTIRSFASVAFGLLLASAVAAADGFVDKELGIAVTPPSGFAKSDKAPEVPEAIGSVKGYFVSSQAKDDAGMLLIHAMKLPDGASYDDFRNSLSDSLQHHFGAGYKLVKQEAVEVKGLTGFLLEAEVPGDGKDIKPGGDQKHHLRWYLFRRGDSGLTGVAYSARESAWTGLEPKFTTSFKTIRMLKADN